MKKGIQIYVWLLVSAVAILFMVQCKNEFTGIQVGRQGNRSTGEIRFEEKKYSRTVIDDDFNGSKIIVIMDKNTGGVNKRHEKSFFGGIEIESIKDLTELTGKINEKGINWELWRQILCLKLPTDCKENVLNAIRQLETIEGIKYAGPSHYLWFGATIPDDPSYGIQWGLNEATAGIQAPDAWDIITDASVLVGIIDTGIANHPDLDANLVDGWDFVHDNSITNDDPIGHGTHIAGIIGAVGNNGLGISGVCWNVKLVPLQVAEYRGPKSGGWQPSEDASIAAVGYATNFGIRVVNFSIGGHDEVPGMEQAIEQYPGLFVCIAQNYYGNDNDDPTTRVYPSYYTTFLDNVISVGSIDSDGSLSDFSNIGLTTVDLFAPGGSIPSTFPEGMCNNGSCMFCSWGETYIADGYHTMSGTSMAAPFVTGVAAMLYALHPGYFFSPWSNSPGISAAEIKQIIRESVNVSGLPCNTGGRLNAYNAVRNLKEDEITSIDGRTIVGSIDIDFDGVGIIGKFHLFADGTWVIAERGFLSYPMSYHPATHPDNVQWASVPSAITNYMTSNSISTISGYFNLLVPTLSAYGDMDYHSYRFYLNISSSNSDVSFYNMFSYTMGSLLSDDMRMLKVQGSGSY